MGKTTNGWARDHDRCRSCGTTDGPHRAKGLCGHCYSEAHNQRHKRPDARQGRRRGGLSVRVTEQELRELYVEQELSLQEIADRYGCTRVMILYLMKRHRIPRRSHSEARVAGTSFPSFTSQSFFTSPGTVAFVEPLRLASAR